MLDCLILSFWLSHFDVSSKQWAPRLATKPAHYSVVLCHCQHLKYLIKATQGATLNKSAHRVTLDYSYITICKGYFLSIKLLPHATVEVEVVIAATHINKAYFEAINSPPFRSTVRPSLDDGTTYVDAAIADDSWHTAGRNVQMTSL